MNLWVIFITGLTVGGLTCLAVQGGLLASVIAAREKEEVNEDVNNRRPFLPVFSFLVTKLFAYSILGVLLGFFGEAIGISQQAQIIMQLLAGIYMVAIALNLLNVHPIFRYVVIQPPKFILRRVRSRSKSKDIFAPAVLGMMTIFIPCGTTLAMEALAISSGNALSGGLIMGVFILGTTPLFFGLGFLTSLLGDKYRAGFLKIAGIAVIYLGLTSVNGAFIASGFPVNTRSVSTIFNNTFTIFHGNKIQNRVTNQSYDIFVLSNGYSPNRISVKRNMPVTITLNAKDAYSCASAFRIPSYGISKNLQPNEKYTFTFTPTKAGQVIFTCSMGMYSGVIDVI